MIITKEKIKKRYISHRKWVEKNRQKYLEYHRKYNQLNKEKRRIYLTKRRAINRIKDNAHYARTKDRHRELHAARKYGISVQEYRDLFIKYNNCCAVCNKPEKSVHRKSGVVKYLAVDHNHKTGKVRGLLCQNCNNAIGHIHENIELLDKIKSYLLNANTS